MLIHKPKELSWEQAASVPEVCHQSIHYPLVHAIITIKRQQLTLPPSQTWITATQALYLIGGFAPGKSILWHAGASSVSIAGIQLSKADHGSEIFVTAVSDEKIEFCVKELGATAGNFSGISSFPPFFKSTFGFSSLKKS